MATLDCTKTFDGTDWSACATMTWAAYGAASAGENSDAATVFGGNTGIGVEDKTANYDGSADAWTTIDAELPATAYGHHGAGAGLI